MIPEKVIEEIRIEMSNDLHGSLQVYLQEFGTRLLFAIGRGEVKLPGEVGRCKAALGEFTPMVNWAHGIWKEGLLTTEHETTTFIAVREEEK